MINDSIKVTGDVHIIKYDENGIITHEEKINNLVVATGKRYIAARLAKITGDGAPISHMAIGTSSQSPASSDTALGSQIATRSAISSLTQTDGNTYCTISANFSGGTYASTNVNEAGLFNALSGGLMIARTTFPTFTIASGDTVAISWTLNIL